MWNKPWLWLPSQWAHDFAPKVLPIAALFSGKKINHPPFYWKGLTFPNPIGIAGGVDKIGTSLLAWEKLNAGFLEVGTITPKAQNSNPGTVIDRDIDNEILWNKLGFPNAGSVFTLTYLQKIKPKLHTPLFINIGKNRTTDNASAFEDYIYCLKSLCSVADTFVINISSPNTSGLRDLLQPNNFTSFLKPILQQRDSFEKKIPLLLKLSPDMHLVELKNVLSLSMDMGVDGWVVANTTLDRSIAKKFPQDGGVSGRALTLRSREILATTIDHIGAKKKDHLLISVGGIMSAEEVRLRLNMGADLVQVYSALVFKGPYFIKKCLQHIH